MKKKKLASLLIIRHYEMTQTGTSGGAFAGQARRVLVGRHEEHIASEKGHDDTGDLGEHGGCDGCWYYSMGGESEGRRDGKDLKLGEVENTYIRNSSEPGQPKVNALPHLSSRGS